MKIFLSFLQSDKRYDIPAYGFWQYYIKNGITEAGYEWMECPDADWALGLVPQSDEDLSKWKEITWSKTVDWLKKHPADIFLSYLYPKQVDISAINQIKKLGIPCVNFFCDHIRDFRKLPNEFKVFDLSWVPEYNAINLYKKANYPFINLPMPMWVDPAKRILKPEINQQLTFIGSKDIQRTRLFEEVIALAPEFPLVVYGSGWKEDGVVVNNTATGYTLAKKLKFNADFIKNEGLSAFTRKIKYRKQPATLSGALASKVNSLLGNEEYNNLSAASMITLGVNMYPSFRFPMEKPGAYSRLRDIEAPMLGACYLTGWAEGIGELYDLDKEIAIYRNAEELIHKARELQADTAKRKALKINGQKRALTFHSIPGSLTKLKARLGL